MKRVLCTHCVGEIEVANKAMSIFCPHCKKRLILESYKVKTYKAVREFATCGDIVVERKGNVAAQVMAQNLLVKGRIKGSVQARDLIEIAKTGEVSGDIVAPRLIVKDGAMLRGFCRIEPIQPIAKTPPKPITAKTTKRAKSATSS